MRSLGATVQYKQVFHVKHLLPFPEILIDVFDFFYSYDNQMDKDEDNNGTKEQRDC